MGFGNSNIAPNRPGDPPRRFVQICLDIACELVGRRASHGHAALGVEKGMRMRMSVCLHWGNKCKRYCEGRPQFEIHEDDPNLSSRNIPLHGRQTSMPHVVQKTCHRSCAIHPMCPDVPAVSNTAGNGHDQWWEGNQLTSGDEQAVWNSTKNTMTQ
jgi:hypothetical protein